MCIYVYIRAYIHSRRAFALQEPLSMAISGWVPFSSPLRQQKRVPTNWPKTWVNRSYGTKANWPLFFTVKVTPEVHSRDTTNQIRKQNQDNDTSDLLSESSEREPKNWEFPFLEKMPLFVAFIIWVRLSLGIHPFFVVLKGDHKKAAIVGTGPWGLAFTCGFLFDLISVSEKQTCPLVEGVGCSCFRHSCPVGESLWIILFQGSQCPDAITLELAHQSLVKWC